MRVPIRYFEYGGRTSIHIHVLNDKVFFIITKTIRIIQS